MRCFSLVPGACKHSIIIHREYKYKNEALNRMISDASIVRTPLELSGDDVGRSGGSEGTKGGENVNHCYNRDDKVPNASAKDEVA